MPFWFLYCMGGRSVRLLESSFVFDQIGTEQKSQGGSISEALSMFRDLPPNHLHCNSVYLNLSIYLHCTRHSVPNTTTYSPGCTLLGPPSWPLLGLPIIMGPAYKANGTVLVGYWWTYNIRLQKQTIILPICFCFREIHIQMMEGTFRPNMFLKYMDLDIQEKNTEILRGALN